MQQTKPAVLVTFDSMKYANSGYFSFGKGLGDALINQNRDRFKLSFYMFKNTQYTFGNKVPLIWLAKLHKLFFSKRNEFELVHFTDQTCRLKPWRVNARRIMTLHDINNAHLSSKSPRKVAKLIRRLRRYMAYCERVVTISQFVADDILRFIPEIKDKLRVIHNGAERLIVPQDHEPVYRPAKPFLFTIGLLSPQKGFHHIPALLEGNDYELVIAGRETPHKATILAEAAKYDCTNRVTLTGQVTDEDKAWYFANCTAFIFPSIAEGFGLPIIEAMHFGKPVFLVKYTSLPEVGGSAAYYFDNFNAADMQKAFADGMADYQNNDRRGKIIKHAEAFSWEAAANKYLQLYQECLSVD